MDRLLTDRDILDILEPIIEPEKVARLRANAEDLAIFTSEYCVVAITQDAKTLKTVAEWMLDRCTEHVDQYYPLRFLCKLCMLDVVYSALHKGLLPGEKE